MKPITMVKGETRNLRYQIKEDGNAKDITGMSFKLGVKEKLTDTAYKIGPIDGTIDDATAGEFSFTVAAGSEAFCGVYEVAMYAAGGAKTVLSAPRGEAFRVVESIID